MMDDFIPYFVHDEIMARFERTVKRLWILCILTILLLVGTNAYWIWYENQWVDYVEVTQDTPNGNNNYVGRDGNITNGTPDSN